jgi:sigma-B regulation protein RsbU (phosphoserine phosphatase)
MTPARTLIADDQPEVLEALRLLLKREGFQPEVVSSPDQIVEALQSGRFDLLLMDLNYARDTTSGQEGLDLLRQIQALDATLPVIVMTGWGSVELAVEVMRRGVRDFVQKPWDNERLVGMLRAHIEHGRIERRAGRLVAEQRDLAAAVAAAENLHVLLDTASERIRRALEARSAVIFSRARDHAFWAAAAAGAGADAVGRLRFGAESPALARLDSIAAPADSGLTPDEARVLDAVGCVLLAPVRIDGELMACVAVGEPASGEPYDEDARKFLAAALERIGAGMDALRLRGQTREYEEAREIQQGLLPKSIPQIDGHEVHGAWQPASAVGGDYFDVLGFSRTRLGLCIADVVGKGMPAALLMSNLQAAVRAFAGEAAQPKDVASKVNRVLASNIASNKFITFFYALCDGERRVLRYTNAGHNPPILVRADGSHTRLHEGGAVLGVFSDWTFEQSEVPFAPGGRLVLFTDGVTEARNAADEEFGEERLIEIVRDGRALPAQLLSERVMSALARFSGTDFEDDATLIVLSAD